MAECERLMAAFKTQIGSSALKSGIMDIKTMFAKPDWMKAPVRCVSYFPVMCDVTGPVAY